MAFCATCLLAAPATCPAYTFQSVGLYHSYSELGGWAYDLETQNPGLVRVIEFGRSTEGRPLYAVNITVDPSVNDPSKPEFLFTAGLHARAARSSRPRPQWRWLRT
jgi:hypothetical protein